MFEASKEGGRAPIPLLGSTQLQNSVHVANLRMRERKREGDLADLVLGRGGRVIFQGGCLKQSRRLHLGTQLLVVGSIGTDMEKMNQGGAMKTD